MYGEKDENIIVKTYTQDGVMYVYQSLTLMYLPRLPLVLASMM